MFRPERRCPCKSRDGKTCRCPTERVRWRAGLYGPDGRKLTRTFATQREARAWAAAQEAALGRGELPAPIGSVLFRDWVTDWQTTRAMLKASTRDADRARLPRLLDRFGSMALPQIDQPVIRQWVAELVEDGYASKTVRHYHALLHSILDLAVTARLIPVNPCKGTPLPELVEREPVFLDEAEVAALVDAHPERWRALPLTLVGTGLRWAETVGLRCRYVDLRRQELTVAWTFSARNGWQTPKSKAGRRVVSLPDRVVEALDVQLHGRGPDEHVFTMPTGNPLNEGYRSRVWRKAVKEAGLEVKGPRPHDLRHTHASMLILAGVPLTVVQRRLGHASIAITSDVYGHISPAAERLAAAAMDLALGVKIPDTVPEGL